jgi:hypothetical protein
MRYGNVIKNEFHCRLYLYVTKKRLSTLEWSLIIMKYYQEWLRLLTVVAFNDPTPEFHGRAWGKTRKFSVNTPLKAINYSQAGFESQSPLLKTNEFLGWLIWEMALHLIRALVSVSGFIQSARRWDNCKRGGGSRACRCLHRNCLI